METSVLNAWKGSFDQGDVGGGGGEWKEGKARGFTILSVAAEREACLPFLLPFLHRFLPLSLSAFLSPRDIFTSETTPCSLIPNFIHLH